MTHVELQQRFVVEAVCSLTIDHLDTTQPTPDLADSEDFGALFGSPVVPKWFSPNQSAPTRSNQGSIQIHLKNTAFCGLINSQIFPQFSEISDVSSTKLNWKNKKKHHHLYPTKNVHFTQWHTNE